MGYFRFRRSKQIAPGLRLNLNKKSVGLSVGRTGARRSVNTSGRTTTTLGIPGTGLSYMDSHNARGKTGQHRAAAAPPQTTQSRQQTPMDESGIFAIACPNCQRQIKLVRDNGAVQTVICPNCSTSLTMQIQSERPV